MLSWVDPFRTTKLLSTPRLLGREVATSGSEKKSLQLLDPKNFAASNVVLGTSPETVGAAVGVKVEVVEEDEVLQYVETSVAEQLAGLVGKPLEPAVTSVRLEMCRSGRIPFISCICASEEVADWRVSDIVRRVDDKQQPDIMVAFETTDDAPLKLLPRYIRATQELLLEGSALTAPDPTWKSCDDREEETIDSSMSKSELRRAMRPEVVPAPQMVPASDGLLSARDTVTSNTLVSVCPSAPTVNRE